MNFKPYLLTLIVLVTSTTFALISSPSQAATATLYSTSPLRILEIRYFPKGETDLIYHPNQLSAQLQDLLRQASRFHGYKSPTTPSSISPITIEVINRYKPRPNTDGNWGTTYQDILAEDNLCQKIKDLNIDQVWLWVDPRPGYDPNPGVEYAISSNMFQTGVQFATVATPAFCNGEKSFVIMGFDYSRPADLALHSFGHYLEGLLGNLQTIELFWYRFGGNNQASFPLSERCGNVHYPPNGTIDYDYANQTTVNTACENWNPDNTGTKTAYNCTRWGCTQEGYLKWWMQNMPNQVIDLTYQNQTLPNWWSFVTRMDETIPWYYNHTNYFMNRNFLAQNGLPPVPSPSASPSPSPSPSPSTSPSPSPSSSPIIIPIGGQSPSPSPSPSPLPSPSSSVSPSTTPIPSPIPNLSPTITNRLLRPGRVNRSYRTKISVQDKNTQDSLSLTLANIPPDLALTDCTTSTRSTKTILACTLEGTPTQTGSFEIIATASDGFTTTYKSLPLRIFGF